MSTSPQHISSSLPTPTIPLPTLPPPPQVEPIKNPFNSTVTTENSTENELLAEYSAYAPDAGNGDSQTTDADAQDGGSENTPKALARSLEQQMLAAEAACNYLEAERLRKQLQSVRASSITASLASLTLLQQEDITLFYTMVTAHQTAFNQLWQRKQLEHKQRADALISQLQERHANEQQQLYAVLSSKRHHSFNVELLNLRKRQFFLAKQREYIEAEKIKRRADQIEKQEVGRIQAQLEHENEHRISILLRKQANEREQLSTKLVLEKKALQEAKAQDFQKLKKRLKNAESELRKTHIRQQLVTEKKMNPNVAVLLTTTGKENILNNVSSPGGNKTQPNASSSASLHSNTASKTSYKSLEAYAAPKQQSSTRSTPRSGSTSNAANSLTHTARHRLSVR